MADRLVDIGVPEDRLVVKAHFVHDPGPRLAPPSESDEVLCVGRLAPGKGVDTLVAAWSLRDDPSSRLVVVGDGPDRDTLAATAGAGVELVGWSDRDEVTERLLRARALVMPSELYETFGMVLIEAMSAGLPVIATTVAAARSIVGPDGIIAVGPGDRVALAGAIDALDDDTTDRMGAANRMSYLDRYTPEVGVAALEALYDGVRSS
jgi:glycosyltransferase involved in cell wall biosynthesis